MSDTHDVRVAKMRIQKQEREENEAYYRSRQRAMQFMNEWNSTHTSSPSFVDAIEWADNNPI